MRAITETSRFRKDIKRQQKRGCDLDKLALVVEELAKIGTVSARHKPHALGGTWRGMFDCHIEHDWLLLYEVTETEVLLYRTGTHADLFE